MKTKILAIDDNIKICELLKDYSQSQTEYDLDYAHDKQSALEHLATNDYRLVTLDIELETESGLDIVEDIKKLHDVPVIFLSVLHDSETVITALERGADDYVKKPFHVKELFLRIDKIIERYYNSDRTLQIADYTINEALNVVYRNKQQIDLSTLPSKILIILLKSVGTPISREELFKQLWGSEYEYSSRVIDAHIRKIRIETNDPRIKSVRGFGYVFEENEK